MNPFETLRVEVRLDPTGGDCRWRATVETFDAGETDPRVVARLAGANVLQLTEQLVSVCTFDAPGVVMLVRLAAGGATEAVFFGTRVAPRFAAGTKCAACFGSGMIAGRVCNICAGSGAHA